MAALKLCPVILILCLCLINGALFTFVVNDDRYDPTWESLDKRPLPEWYDKAKVGIFLHWGVYSVPSFGSEWFWINWKSGDSKYVSFMKQNYAPGFTYQDFAKDFTAEFFDPDAWAKLFKQAGAQYVVLTSKHHEGYTLWPSKYSFSWNAVDVGPKRDLLGELAAAVRKNGLKFGLYHSLFEWFNPLYLSDKSTNFTQSNFLLHKIVPEMVELVLTYKPEVIWSDGDWEASDTYWKSTEFLAWLYNESPVKDTVVANDRWGKGIPCHHGDFYTCSDRYNPGVLQPHKWENAMTIDKHSWGYRRNANVADYYTAKELIAVLVETISCGGNILMNVGPTHDGTIAPIFQDRLLKVGQWLSLNGEAIYGSKPWKHQNDSISDVWYTAKESAVYAIALDWPAKNVLQLGYVFDLFTAGTPVVTLLGSANTLKWWLTKSTVMIQFPDKATVSGQWAWVLKIQGFKSVETNEWNIY